MRLRGCGAGGRLAARLERHRDDRLSCLRTPRARPGWG